MPTIGSRLKEIRNELRLSQEAFGDKLGVTRAAIAAVEADNNKFSQDTLCKLLLTFNVNINYLLAGIGQPFNAAEFEDVKSEILNEVNSILAKYGIKNKWVLLISQIILMLFSFQKCV